MKQSEPFTNRDNITLAPSNDPEILEMQKRYIALQTAELEERLAEKEAKKDDLKRFQLSRKSEIDAIDNKRRMEQSACSHKKPNGYAALDGQRDSNNRLHLICNFCNAEFDGIEAIPPDLRRTINSERIGGPA